MTDTEKPEQRRANDNPWYCLATLYGEQPVEGPCDKDLAAENRLAWNRWMAGALSHEQRMDLMRKGFPGPELTPFTDAEKREFCSAFASRTGREKELPPDPAGYPGHIDFTNTHFDRVVVFRGFLFAYPAIFIRATFSGYADFRLARFSSLADFHSATFSGYANFSSTTFSHVADFISATFSHVVDFSSATFTGGAGFNSATFSNNASFSSATFSEDAYFRSATFTCDAYFSSATFTGNADFRSATFTGGAGFSSATFSGFANFINAAFSEETVFAYARFKASVPDFRGAKMHEATEWHGVNWPLAPRDKDTAQGQVYSYERLKQEMERLKKFEDEQFFFRKQLRARRGLVPVWYAAWPLNYLYQVLSDYGQSIVRPFLWLFGLFAIGFSVFAMTPVFKGARMTIPDAAWLSFANVFSFLPIRHEIVTAEMVAGLSSAAQIVGVVQSLLGVVLLFLLCLALRIRFRMR